MIQNLKSNNISVVLYIVILSRSKKTKLNRLIKIINIQMIVNISVLNGIFNKKLNIKRKLILDFLKLNMIKNEKRIISTVKILRK